MSQDAHKAHAPRSARAFVLTISDTRTEADDSGGQLCRELLTSAGHSLTGHAIVRDDPAAVTAHIHDLLDDSAGTQVLITTGGTGVSRRDNTYEAVSALLSRRLDGFGELFRMLSYQEIGSAAMLSRAVAGLIDSRGAARSASINPTRSLVVFTLPGSLSAVRLGLSQLILPELGHLIFESRR